MVSEAGEYSRLLRPYSSRRLTHALYQVEATAASITQAKLRLLIDPPFDAAEWQFELEELQAMLETLADQASWLTCGWGCCGVRRLGITSGASGPRRGCCRGLVP
jgi:hypothetical protein